MSELEFFKFIQQMEKEVYDIIPFFEELDYDVLKSNGGSDET
jgi:hypothetical protein